MIAYKEENLRDEEPRCRLERVAVDLRDQSERKALISRASENAKKVLVVTEGLLIYLSEEQVGTLARDLSEAPSFRLWLTDIASPRLLKMLMRRYGRHLSAANAPFQFAPASGTKYFEAFGWKEREFRSSFEEAHRLHREMPMAWLFRFIGKLQPPSRREEFRRMGGIVLLGRTSA